MKNSFFNKHALVCGSTDGIGKESAIQLAKNGCEVTLISRNEKKLIKTLGELSTKENQSHSFLVADFNETLLLEKNNINNTIVFFGSARLKSKEQALEDLELEKTNPDDTNIKILETDLKMSRYYEEARQLAGKYSEWSRSFASEKQEYIICSGGGPGIMEAANRGSAEVGAKNIGLTISLPFEDSGNDWITEGLNMKFHYFFMRKFWFLYHAKAIVVWPGGFGTLDELMEVLTLIQTKKIMKSLPIVLYGKEFWKKVVNWDYLVEVGTIAKEDLDLLYFTDDVDDAFNYVTNFIKNNKIEGPIF
ncbi:SDR family NAD(P)-dependent oxidoreductase [bacterium]|nr:SDR family NAD(P)-dependent oxidoreductase [bacterium]